MPSKEKSWREDEHSCAWGSKAQEKGSLLQSVPTALGRRNPLAPLAMKPDTEKPLLISVGFHNMPREDCGMVLVL